MDEIDDLNKTDNLNVVILKSETMPNAPIDTVVNFVPRPKWKLSEVERQIRKHQIIVPCPSRQTLIGMCEEGVFETVGEEPTNLGWLIFADSFWKWARELDGLPVAA